MHVIRLSELLRGSMVKPCFILGPLSRSSPERSTRALPARAFFSPSSVCMSTESLRSVIKNLQFLMSEAIPKDRSPIQILLQKLKLRKFVILTSHQEVMSGKPWS